MNKNYFVINLIVILALSLSAGFFISTKIYNDQWQEMMLQVEELLENRRFNLVEKEDPRLLKESMAYNLNNQIFLVAREKSGLGKDILTQSYAEQDFLAYAIVATNDGWLITNTDIKKTDSLVIIDNENQIIKVQEVETDPVLGINYLKIDKTGLNPIAIADSNNLEIGEMVYAIEPNLYSFRHEIITNSIRNLHTRSIQTKSDLVYQADDILYGLLNNTLKKGLPVVNNKSQFIGFSVNFNEESYLLPSKYIRYSLTSLFSENRQITYPSLGIEYIDLSELIIDNDLPNKGALVYNVLDQKSFFQKDDIILKVENDEINELKSLNEILLDYQINDKIKLLLLRDGEEQELSVIIKAFNE